MKVKKTPQRMCVITHEKCDKKDLIRIVRAKDGSVSVDITGKMNGKGAYIKRDLDVLKKAIKSKALEKHLEISINDDIYNELEKIINE